MTKQKILFIGQYKNNTNSGRLSENTILSLASNEDIDIVCRSVPNKTNEDYTKYVNKKIFNLEDNNTQDITSIIQHVEPSIFEYKKGLYNIGILEHRTNNFNYSDYMYPCNLMDEILVFSENTKQAAIKSGVTTNIHVIECGCDTSSFEHDTESADIGYNDALKFHTVIDSNNIKSIVPIIRAYYSVFNSDDNVVLVMTQHTNNEDLYNQTKSIIGDIKKAVHIYQDQSRYPKIMVVKKQLYPKDMNTIHKHCDVFISCLKGDSYGVDIQNAMGFGCAIIAPNWLSAPSILYEQHTKYFDTKTETYKDTGDIPTGWLVGGQLSPCFGVVEQKPCLYNGKEMWFDPDLVCLANIFRKAYHGWRDGTLQNKKDNAKKRTEYFSYRNIGEKILHEMGNIKCQVK